MLRIERIWITWTPDTDGDPSFLDRTAEDHYGENGAAWNHVSAEQKRRVEAQYGSIWDACVAYAKQDAKRLKAFDDGEWHMMGCVAHAEVSYEESPCGSRRLQVFTSGGIWGIESDSDSDFKGATEKDQLDDLKAHLQHFGVDVSNFEGVRVERPRNAPLADQAQVKYSRRD